MVLTQLFLVMGVWPLIYTALLVPSGKSANGVPAWPFLTASYALGEPSRMGGRAAAGRAAQLEPLRPGPG